MMAHAGGYYVVAFKGSRLVTQGNPLSPTIFNVMVDAVVRNWVMVMVEGAEEQVGIRIPYYTQTMAWLHRRTHNDSRVNLVPWSTCLIGWSCRLMPGRKSAWSAVHTRRQVTSQSRRMGEG